MTHQKSLASLMVLFWAEIANARLGLPTHQITGFRIVER